MLYYVEMFIAYLLYYSGVYSITLRRLKRKGTTIALVYHRVHPGPSKIGQMVSEQEFSWQMDFLAKEAAPVTWSKIAESPSESFRGIRVLVTFDDGYKDNFTVALPILERARVPAVFFVVTKFVFGRQVTELDDKVNDQDCPNDSDLKRAISSDYVIFGNHTDTHRLVSSMTNQELSSELHESQQQFESRLGENPDLFAYPRGRQADICECSSILRDHGIAAAFTMIPGRIDLANDDPYMLKRIGVSHVNNRVLFKVKAIGLMTPFIRVRNVLFP